MSETRQNSSHSLDPESFVRLLMANERRVYGFILTLVTNTADADDLMQETSAVLWRKYGAFEQGTDFAAWAMRIARYEVLKFRERRGGAAGLSEKVMDSLAEVAQQVAGEADARHEALQGCIQKLGSRDQQVIAMRYDEGATVKHMAARIGLSVFAVYKSLTRIHQQLHDCIERTIAREHRS
ncbi:MAG: sigma-70 family RNA polymerase sigma factor [Planctomycetes bacterium]|nr:sigma-70 family RNA polymerase sigma factor [Planctomycetota bacterium]